MNMLIPVYTSTYCIIMSTSTYLKVYLKYGVEETGRAESVSVHVKRKQHGRAGEMAWEITSTVHEILRF